MRQPNFLDRQTGDGGSLGVYSHANSPLRKAASTNFNEIGRERERSISPIKREVEVSQRRAYKETSTQRLSGKV